MRITRKFQSAVAELVAWLEGKDKPGYASDTDFIDPAFEDMVDLQQKRKRLDELIRTVKNSTWTLPTERFAHDEEFQKTFGFSKDSAAARLWMEILQLPTINDAFEEGIVRHNGNFLVRGVQLNTSRHSIVKLAGMGFDTLEKLAKYPGLPDDSVIEWHWDLAQIDARIPPFCLHVHSDKLGTVKEGLLPPAVSLCFFENRHGQLFADGIQLTGTDAWIEGTHNFEDGRYR